MSKTCFGLIVGNRDFFPDSLVEQGRTQMMQVLEKLGFDVVCLQPSDTKMGAVETYQDAKKCAKLFSENSGRIDGIIVTLPNFGDEKAIAAAIRMSGLSVPILVHAFPDDPERLDIAHRRDSFCGKISVCNNLKQFGLTFSLTSRHTLDPSSSEFQNDVVWFARVCKVVKAVRNLKLGAIGARPNAFNTVRFSEKILERFGISVETLDLSEVIYRMENLSDEDEEVQKLVSQMKEEYHPRTVPDHALRKMAKLFLVINRWINENEVKALAIQCWTILERKFGITPCTVMSMFSERMIPAACEVDVLGALSMYLLQIASGMPSALADWNNNYSENEVILFHCGNFPKSMYETVEMSVADVIANSVGRQNAYGACAGKIKSGPFTFFRLTTDDPDGLLEGYIGEGEILREDAKTFGSRGIARIESLERLMNYICSEGFEHHVAVSLSRVSNVIFEAMKYLGVPLYKHS